MRWALWQHSIKLLRLRLFGLSGTFAGWCRAGGAIHLLVEWRLSRVPESQSGRTAEIFGIQPSNQFGLGANGKTDAADQGW